MFNIKLEGFDEVKRNLENLQKKTKELEGAHNIPLKELFPPEFLKTNTKFSSLEDMFVNSGFPVESQEDFTRIPVSSFFLMRQN